MYLREIPSTAYEDPLETARMLAHEVAAQEQLLKQNRELNRGLVRELTLDKDKGCYRKKSLEGLTIFVQGTVKDKLQIAESAASDTFGAFARHSMLSFDLGPGLYFQVDGHKLIEDGSAEITPQDETLTLGDLQHLKIAKTQNAYQLNEHITPRGCGFLWLKHCNQFLLFEKDRWHIHRMKITLGDQTIYQKNPLDHLFAGDTLQWQDPEFLSNPFFQHTLERDDCLVQQLNSESSE